MRRTLLAILSLAAASPLCGCAECEGPEQVSAVEFQMFASVRTFGAVSATPDEVGVGTSPANGSSYWVITWGNGGLKSPITVAIDDQPFDATGVWDDTECGNFSIDVPQQTYLGQDGVAHEFTLAASFLTYARRLEGSGYYTETWTTTAGDSGKFVAEQLELRGVHPLDE